jgi:glycine/D-amino acid oxidase-like deaminating enzyme/Rieske Fe-S protein
MIFVFNGKHVAYWLDSAKRTKFPPVSNEMKFDVVIIGGGLTGITTGFMLKQLGFKVAIIEANRTVSDISAGTTAKITTTSSLIYSDVLSNFGKEFALKFRSANVDSFNTIKNIVEEFNIDCDYRSSQLYLYSSHEESFSLIQKEYDSLKELGINAELIDDLPTPHKGFGILYKNQAEFHPKKYLNALINLINGEGSFVFEKTRALTVEDVNSKEIKGKNSFDYNKDDCKRVITDKGDIFGNFVVVATHVPIYDPDFVCNFMNQNKSYVVGCYPQKYKNKDMFVDINPFHSYRSTPTDKGEMIIVAGEHHNVGEVIDTWKYFKSLTKFVKELFDIEDIEYFWSNQDNNTKDNIPIIGETSHEGVYIATGFGSWGMTTGTIAANIITQLILNKLGKTREANDINFNININNYIDIFNPQRFKGKKSSKNIEKYLKSFPHNHDKSGTDQSLTEKEYKLLTKYLMELEHNEAKIITIGENSIAIYKDSDSSIYAVSSKSTHSGCDLVWNTAEKSWECPKFGSRFRFDGKVIHGPAVYDLESYIKRK